MAALRKQDLNKLSGSPTYADYILAARLRFEDGQAATVAELRQVYRRAAAAIRKDIEAVTPGTLRAAHLAALAKNLETRAKELNTRVLGLARQGIYVSAAAGTSAAEGIAEDLLAEAFDKPDVKRLFAGINERATLALLSRTGKDGLKLSDRVWRVSERYRNAAKRVIEDGVARGLDARKLGREVEKYLEPRVWTAQKLDTRRRLGVPKDVSYEGMRLARTEMNNAFHEGAIAANKATPSYLGIYWRLSNAHVLDDVCNDYAAHNGKGFWPKGQEPARPHPQCLVAGAVISGPRVLATTARWYRGEVIEIETVQGRHLTVTPNHPILTPEGWVAAGMLHEGSNVVCGGGQERDSAMFPPAVHDPEDYQVPALIEDVVRSFGKSGSVVTTCVPTSAEDFHGDGVGSEVCVIGANRLLGNGFDASFSEPRLQQYLVGRDSDLTYLMREGFLTLGFEGLGLTPGGIMGSLSPEPPLFGSPFGVDQLLRFLDSAGLDSGFKQDTSDGTTSDPIPSGESLLGFTGQVRIDQVARIGRKPFAGHVYNLQTSSGWYIANGIVTHNCMCVITPVHEDPKEFTERLRAWMADPASQMDLEQWYNGTARTVLKRPSRGSLVPEPPGPSLGASAEALVVHDIPAPAAAKAEIFAEEIRALTEREGVEFAGMLDVDSQTRLGAILRGTQHSVDISPHLAAMQPGRRYIQLHAHGNSSAFSDADAAVLVEHPEIAAIGVLGVDGTAYSLSRIPGGITSNRHEIYYRFWGQAELLKPKYQQKIMAGEMTKAEAWKEQTHEVWVQIAQKLGLRYQRIYPKKVGEMEDPKATHRHGETRKSTKEEYLRNVDAGVLDDWADANPPYDVHEPTKVVPISKGKDLRDGRNKRTP